jgi:hypothetical protein
MNTAKLIQFHIRMGRELGLKFVFDPGLYQRFLRGRFERILKPLEDMLPASMLELRPMCFKNIVFLPWAPGASDVSWIRQVRTVIHEADHALDIRDYPDSTKVWYERYFLNGHRRANVEANAQYAEAEWMYWYEHTLPELDLKDYFLTQAQRDVGAAIYSDSVRDLKRLGPGHTMRDASKAAIGVCRKLGIDSRVNKR